MNAQELRIGNWINDITGHETQVRGTTKQGIWIGDNAGPGPEVAFTPIELTPEWLERFGFEYEEGFADDYTKEPISLYNNPFLEGWTVETIFSELIKKNMLNIKYVHQLQNLYFALTGQELEFKTD